MEPRPADDTVYFGGLNGLRFFAATSVIFHHIEEYKMFAIRDGSHYCSLYSEQSVLGIFYRTLGEKAVSLFFVLSGFLITYLLLAEVKKTGFVSLKKFYIRRMLRIWPVYYLVILVAFFVIPPFFDLGHEGWELHHHNFYPWLALCVFMLPNLIRYNTIELVGGNQTWSVGVEEQFYLMWPWLVRTFHKHFVRMLFVLIIIKMTLGFLAFYLGVHATNPKVQHVANLFALHWMLFKIEQMAIGAMGAWCLFHKKENILKLFYHPGTTITAVVFLAWSMVTTFIFPAETLVEALVFLVIILNVSTNPAFPVKLRHPWFNKLGTISYGIYMYHTIVITLLIHFLQFVNLDHDQVVFNLLLYSGSVLFTILIAHLSFRYFESRFLSLKEKFMVVKSSVGPVL